MTRTNTLGADRAIQKAIGGLIRDTHRVESGYMCVPQTPGLGREIDWQWIGIARLRPSVKGSSGEYRLEDG